MMEMLRKQYANKIKGMIEAGCCEPQKKKYKPTKKQREELNRAIDTVDHPRRVGAQHFKSAAFIEFTQQRRSQDEKHTEFITGMYHGVHVTGGEISRRYNTLSKEDFLEHDETGNYHGNQRKGWVVAKMKNNRLALSDSGVATVPQGVGNVAVQPLTMEQLLNKTRGFKEDDYDDLFKGVVDRLDELEEINNPRKRKAKDRRFRVIGLEILMYCRYHSCQPWFEAPIVCGTHRSRMSLTHQASINFATTVGEVVVRWPVEWREWEQSPEDGMRSACIDNDPCFHQYFVSGGRGSFSATVDKKLGFVNASSFVFHSICMDTADKQHDYEKRVTDAAPGTVITLSEQPQFVNIAIHPSDMSAKKLKRLNKVFRETDATFEDDQTLEALQKDSGYVIVPIQQSEQNRDFKAVPVRGAKNSAYNVSRVKVRSYFPLSLMLTMTVNRSQGQTMLKIILALSYNPIYVLTYAHLYVALSRVRKGKDVRLLVSGNNKVSMAKSLAYISRLKPDTAMMAMLHGFRVGQGATLSEWVKGVFNDEAAVERLVHLESR